MKHKVSLSRDKGISVPFGTGKKIKKAALTALKAQRVDFPCSINVLLTDDNGIREINNQFRDIDRETDVLSFPQYELSPGEPFSLEMFMPDPNTGRVLLGDMAISVQRVCAQGTEFGHGFKREIQYLTVHSVLHLLGYDHVDEGEGKKNMREREEYIMGLINGAE